MRHGITALAVLAACETPHSSEPVDVAERVVDVDAYGDRTCWADQNGDVTCIGVELPAPVDADDVPIPVTLGAPALAVAVGASHACAAHLDHVTCWGEHADNSPLAPSRIADVGAVIALEAGDRYTCAIAADDRRVLCWGPGPVEPVTDDAGAPVIAQRLSVVERQGCAVTPDGAAWCWDWRNRATRLDGAGVVDVAVGLDHRCVVTDNGKVTCAGENLNAESGDPARARRCTARPCLVGATVVDAPDATAVAVGDRHSCAQVDDGLWCWGSNEWGQLGRDDAFLVGAPGRVGGIGRVLEVVGGKGHTCARDVAGTLWCWGLDLSVMTCSDNC